MKGDDYVKEGKWKMKHNQSILISSFSGVGTPFLCQIMGSIVMEPEDISSYARIYRPHQIYSSICVSIGKVSSRGICRGDNPLQYTLPRLLLQLSVSSFAFLFAAFLLKPLRLPTINLQILGGLLLGPSFLGRIAGFASAVYPFDSLVIVDTVALFGCMFYFFLIGVQLDSWILKKMKRREVVIGASTVFFGMLLSESITVALRRAKFSIDADVEASLPAVAVASSMISFPVIAQYLTELKMVNTDYGRMALSSLFASNIAFVLLLTMSVIARQSGSETLKSVQNLIGAAGFTLVIFLVVRPIILWKLRRIPEGEQVKQEFILIIFCGILLTAFCSKAVGLHMFYGPLVYGMAIPAGPPLGSAIVEKLDFINSRIFMPLYFAKHGLVVDIFSVKFGNYFLVQFVILVACIGKFLGAMISALYYQVPLTNAIQVGLVANVQGVMDLNLFKLMKQDGAIHEEPFIVLCMSMVIVTAFATLILRRMHDPFKRYTVKKRKVLGLRPDSELRIVACIHDDNNVPSTIKLIEGLHPTTRSPLDICLIHLVELVGCAHPILVNHKMNKENSRLTSTSRSIINAFRRFQQVYPHGALNLNPYTSVCPYVTMHYEIFEMAIDKRASLIITQFQAEPDMIGSSRNYVKALNDNILELSPCSVAVLVDRASIRDTESCPLCHLAVLFIGGADDREALAIAMRMAFGPNINFTIIRIVGEDNIASEDEDETKFDNHIVEEVRNAMDGNERFGYVEEVVSDGTGTVSVMQSIEGRYDVIMLGRHHDPRSPLMLGMTSWDEDESGLGAVGDMFASPDFKCNSLVVVVQQGKDNM